MKYLAAAIVTGVGVVIVILAGVLGFIVVPNIIDDQIVKQVRLVEGEETWDKWKDIPIPIYLNFYIYHVKNADAYEAGIDKIPDLEEHGPYSYKQTRAKVNISQPKGKEKVTFQEVKTYTFDETTSCETCTEDDEWDIINIPFVSVIAGVAAVSPTLAPLIANGILRTERLIRRNVKAGELTFKGFDVSLYWNNPILHPLLPEEFKDGLFGLYRGKSGATDGEYEVYTGVSRSEDFGKIISWEGNTTVDFWWVPGSPCAMINGTDGSIFPPFVEKSRRLEIFVTDLCRSLYLTYESEIEHRGIKGYRFTAPKEMLEDPRINLDNQCFCMEDNPDDCPYGGVLSVGTCRGGAPISMSTPHFLDGDHKYVEATGLSDPVREEHVTYIDLEPHTGVALRASKKIQVNLDVKKFPGIKATENITDYILFPLLWADEKASLDDKQANDLKSKLLTPLKIVNISKWVVLAVGCLLVGVGLGLFIMKNKRKSNFV